MQVTATCEVDFHTWLHFGIDQKYVDPPVCDTHEGVRLYPEEQQEFEDGGDPCIPVMRLLDDE